MPMYQYKCNTCENEFKLRRPRIDSGKKAPCPECGSDGKRRVDISGQRLKLRD